MKVRLHFEKKAPIGVIVPHIVNNLMNRYLSVSVDDRSAKFPDEF